MASVARSSDRHAESLARSAGWKAFHGSGLVAVRQRSFSRPGGPTAAFRTTRCPASSDTEHDQDLLATSLGGRLRGQSASGAVMRVVLVIIALALLVLLWRAFVFDRKHRGSLRNAADSSGDAKRNRDEHARGGDGTAPL